jgi:hypothetical protein
MGTHDFRGFDRLVLGSTTERVMRRVGSPMLVLPNPAHNVTTTAPDGKHRLSKILYSTDFSINSERALSICDFFKGGVSCRANHAARSRERAGSGKGGSDYRPAYRSTRKTYLKEPT